MGDVILEVGLALITSAFSSGVVGAVVAHVIKKADDKRAETKENDEKQENMEEGIKLLMLDSIILHGRIFIADGQISKTEYDIFKSKYDCYKKLGGDGWADSVFNQVTNLPKEELLTTPNI